MFLLLLNALVQPLDTAPIVLALLGYAVIVCVPGGIGFLLLALSNGTEQEKNVNLMAALGLMALGALEGLALALSEGVSLYAIVTWKDSLVRCFFVAEALGLALTLARALPFGPTAALRVPASVALLAFATFALVYTVVTTFFVLGMAALVCCIVFAFIMFDAFG